MPKGSLNVSLKGADDIFSTEESRQEQQREQDNKREIMELYRDMDQYNRDTWIIIGKRLLGGQLHKYNEDSIIEKRLKE